MKISIGSDHRGYELKKLIRETFSAIVIDSVKEEVLWKDEGALSSQRSDYPVFAKKVTRSILNKESEFGVLICGSGVGMCIAANRNQGIYAGLCFTPQMATMARSDDNINVLVLPSDFLDNQVSINIVKSMLEAWAQDTFKGGRYQDRLNMIDEV